MKLLKKSFLPCISLVAMLFISACDGDDNNGNISDVHVNLRIDLNNPLYLDLNPYGGYVYIDGVGNRGIVVYHDFSDNYLAYDRICSYEPSNPCSRVEVDESDFFLRCGETVNGDFVPCCSSQFTWDGFPSEGQAIYPLKEYQVFRNGNFLTISN